MVWVPNLTTCLLTCTVKTVGALGILQQLIKYAENKWEKGPDLSPRLGAAAVNVNGKMTITGGKPVKGRCADIVAYDCGR